MNERTSNGHLQNGYGGRGNDLAVAVGLCQLMKAWWGSEGEWYPVGVVCDSAKQGMEEGMVISQPCDTTERGAAQLL